MTKSKLFYKIAMGDTCKANLWFGEINLRHLLKLINIIQNSTFNLPVTSFISQITYFKSQHQFISFPTLFEQYIVTRCFP